MAIEKKLAEKEALQKTMKDNEIHKQILPEKIKKNYKFLKSLQKY